MRPLLTFALFAYNHERFIREAVEGAFLQTYSPLEIILSDDCSDDRTFEIMKEMSNAYKGPHTVILNRNSRNLGVGGHVNRVMELSHGELIIGAAGDDISLPERSTMTYEQWVQSDQTATSIYFQVDYIDEHSKPIEGKKPMISVNWDEDMMAHLRRSCIGIYGASHCWHRKLFDFFGPLNPNVSIEDICLAFRSLLIGKIVQCNRAMVRYRIHDNSVSTALQHAVGETDIIASYLFGLRAFYESYINFLKDIDMMIYRGMENPNIFAIRNYICDMVESLRMKLSFHNGNSAQKRKIIIHLARNTATFVQAIKFMIIYLFPSMYLWNLKRCFRQTG